MKNSRQLRTEIKNFIDLVIDYEIAISANPVVCNNIGSMQRVTWQHPANVPHILTNYEFATIDEYCSLLMSQSYSLVLFDGALVQISFDVQGNRLIGHRLCYYPCPFDIDAEEFLMSSIGDLVETYRDHGSDLFRLRTPIRFDYDPDNAKKNHPATHAHFLWEHCRCSLAAPISLGHFIKFVFNNFYPQLWENYDFIKEWPQEMAARTITPSEERLIHFSCQR